MPIIQLVGHSKTMEVSQPLIMGILNITPDSYYSESRVSSVDQALGVAEQMLKDGASILDIGGQSSRPGSDRISSIDELNRVFPIVKAIRKHFPETWISVDTYFADVAKSCIDIGVEIINDISFGEDDPQMLSAIANRDITYIGMHKKGNPKLMQESPHYDSVVDEVFQYLIDRSNAFKKAGVRNIWIDPGFGFGKTIDHNYQLFSNLNLFCQSEFGVLVGISRKSMIYKLLEINAEESLNATSALNLLALEKGAKILRVHDVKAAKEVLKLHDALHNFAQ
jgi:dihydropteroate synthase